ncbi:unnamed protein product [Mytilus coruscus]|uniref:COR domain-containing protein n=1 Tax=Mytilus coruscus TaxID=42192 RepID=A0A6J8AR60_MYTCO|nr:unnamed protein product [Mytilus coruscus]
MNFKQDPWSKSGFDSIEEYIDFWINNVHCLANPTVGLSKRSIKEKLEPPIIIVGTGTDKIEPELLEEKKRQFKEKTKDHLRNQEKRKHITAFYFLSNLNSSDDIVDELRKKIFRDAKIVTTWEKAIPLVWTFLENEIEHLRQHKSILDFDYINNLASMFSINERENVVSFLNYQHEIGRLIFFETISDFIIIQPKWLADACKCFVTNKVVDDVDTSDDWKELQETGKVSPKLMFKLLQKVPDLRKSKKLRQYLLHIMTKFDIIIQPNITTENRDRRNKTSYYIPTNTIAIQLCNVNHDIGNICIQILKDLERKISIFKNQNNLLNLKYTIKFKCANGDPNNPKGRVTKEEVESSGDGQYVCLEHTHNNGNHSTEELKSTWFKYYLTCKDQNVNQIISAVDEDIHYTEKSSFKLKKERIYDIQTNSNGLLILADGKQDQILTCTLSGGNQKKIKLPGNPDSFAIIDNENIAVTLPYEEDIIFVDISKEIIVKNNTHGTMLRVIPDIKDKPPVKNVYQNNSSELVDSRTYVVYVIVCGVILNMVLIASVCRGIWKESRYLDEETKETYLNDIRSGEERHRHIRVAIIGEMGVGKTCLLRRLLKQSIDGVQSTDGVNIEISKCKIRLRDGQWESYKAKEHESVHANRLKRALAKLKGLEQNLTTNGCDFDADGDESDNQSDSSISGERLSDRDSIVVSSDQETGEIISETILSVSEQVGHSPVNASLKNGNGNKKSVNFEEQQTDIKKQMKKEIDTDRVMKSKDRLLHQTHKQLISNDDKVEYVDCDLWDFAGEKEYYATHQAFISSSCIFLLVADISRDIMNFKQDPWSKSGFDSIEEYIDFWINNVHCLANPTVGLSKRSIKEKLEPPIIIVGTGTDKIEPELLEEKKRQFKEKIKDHLRNQEKRKHITAFYFLSNLNSSDDIVDELRKKIFRDAKIVTTWEKAIPLVWTFLENEIEHLRQHKSILDFDYINNLASMFSINERENVVSFLNYQHEIGRLIFFETISDFIILQPKWLADACKCFVTNKVVDDVDTSDDWKELQETGKVSPKLMFKLLQKVPDLRKSKKLRQYLLHIMTKFDIIIQPNITTENRDRRNKTSYYIPSMIKNKASIEDVRIEHGLTVLTPWVLLEFEFLPLACFNQFFFDFVRKYTVCTKKQSDNVAFYHGMGVFCLHDVRKYEKLVLCFSANTIAIQLCNVNHDIGNICIQILKDLERKISIFKNQNNLLNLKYTIKIKCANGDPNNPKGRVTKEEVESSGDGQYVCLEHTHNNGNHSTEELKSTWFKYYLTCKDQNVNQIISADEDIHYTEKSSFKLKKERIYDIQTNSNGLLILADGKQDQILTCTLSGGNQKKIKLPGNPDSFAIIDNENIAVTLPYEEDIVFVDISKGDIVKTIHMGLCCTAIAYFNSKFIVCVDNTIKILDVDCKVQSTEPLRGFTTDGFSVGKNGKIYCTDYNKLICMDIHANILFTFTGVNTRRPRGVTTDDEGYILVAYDHSHNVHRVSPDGLRSKEIVRKLPKIDWSPFICFDSVTKSIIIGRKDKVIVYTRST